MVVGQGWQLKNDMSFMIDASNAVLLAASHDGNLCSKMVQATKAGKNYCPGLGLWAMTLLTLHQVHRM